MPNSVLLMLQCVGLLITPFLKTDCHLGSVSLHTFSLISFFGLCFVHIQHYLVRLRIHSEWFSDTAWKQERNAKDPLQTERQYTKYLLDVSKPLLHHQNKLQFCLVCILSYLHFYLTGALQFCLASQWLILSKGKAGVWLFYGGCCCRNWVD